MTTDTPVVPPGLVYVDDARPGWTRRLVRGHFSFFDANGKRITDELQIARVRKLAIPPAYRDVWICPNPRGHLQATGRDARGRKQYRYHLEWRTVRDADKYSRMLEFGRALPKIRARVARDLAKPGMGRDRVVAVVVQLLETTLIRVGNAQYARDNSSFGLTTLRNRHARVLGGEIRFSFKGKSGVEHDVKVSDARLARLVRRCMDIPGHELFQYLDEDGIRHPIGSADVNRYLQETVGTEFTAKDYRTWAGSTLALDLFQRRVGKGDDVRHATVEVMAQVAKRLANTPAVCKKAYVHPEIVARFATETLPAPSSPKSPRGLDAAERRMMAFLQEMARAA